jgi:DNA polymerase (family 10)
MKKVKNSDVVEILFEIAEILEMKEENRFKIVAYRRAARSIDLLPVNITEVYKKGKLEEIPGVGGGIAKKLKELIKTGKIKYHEKLKKGMSAKIGKLMKVPGLGPKRIKKLSEVLGVKNVKQLERAAKEHKIAKLPGFGAESEKDILEGIAFAKKARGRISLKEAERMAGSIVKELKKLKEIKKISVAGSLRRKKASIRDIDILVSSTKPKRVVEKFTGLKEVARVLGKGSTKASVELKSGVNSDLRVLSPESWGAGLFYFTGSKDYNIEVRKIAIKKGYKLSEYGLFDKKTGKMVAGKTEEEICKKLGIKCLKPEKRER